VSRRRSCGACQQFGPPVSAVAQPRRPFGDGLAKAGFFVTKNPINASQVDLSFLGYQIFSVKGPLVLLTEAAQVADIDVDFAATRRHCKRDLKSPRPPGMPCLRESPCGCALSVTGMARFIFNGFRWNQRDCLSTGTPSAIVEVKLPLHLQPSDHHSGEKISARRPKSTLWTM
jgi:hypothetical protein